MPGLIGPTHPDYWDPEVFLPQGKIRPKVGGLVPFQLWSHQRIMSFNTLRAYKRRKWLAHLKPRQEGSSAFFTCVATQHAMTRPGCRVAIISHKKDQAKYLAGVAIRFHGSLPTAIRTPKLKGIKRHLEFPKPMDSVLFAASVQDDDPLRGETVQFCMATEISSWSSIAGPDAWTAVRNAVPDPDEGGFIVAESTPKHYGDEMHLVCQEAERPDSPWLKFFIPWTKVEKYSKSPHPGWKPMSIVREYQDKHCITDAQAYWMQSIGLPKCASSLARFRGEYPISELDCWMMAGDAVFDIDKLLEMKKAIDNGVELDLEEDEFVRFKDPVEGHTYVISCDPAGSWSHRDHFAIQVIDVDACEQVAEFLGHGKAHIIANMLAELGTEYNDARVYVEANGIGEATLSHLVVSGYRNVYYRKKSQSVGTRAKARAPGWWSDAKHKADAITRLQKLITDGSITLHSVRCIRQLINYRGEWDGFAARDEGGGHYDLVAALSVGAWAWSVEAGLGQGYGTRLMSDKEKADLAWKRLLRQVDGKDNTKWNSRFGRHI